MTKEQALQRLQEAIDRGIDPDKDVEIFDAIRSTMLLRLISKKLLKKYND